VSRAPSASARVCCRGSQLPVYAKQIIFWLIAGLAFTMLVGWLLGLPAAGSWLYGYFLEYTLSIDNLFVFQLIFRAYSTPDSQVERALFWGISAAVLLRLLFFAVGTQVLALGIIARIAFGLVLVYSGVKTIYEDDGDDEDDPSQNPLVRCIAKLLPLHDSYGDEPTFFVNVPVQDASCEDSPVKASVVGSPAMNVDLRVFHRGDSGEVDAESPTPLKTQRETVLKVTPLFLVVASLGIIDVVFAVDSVTAKISSVSGFTPSVSFFLNLTSSAFAMFVLRSLYMVVDMLTDKFRFLKYGVGAVLILIGVKLILSDWLEIGMLLSCVLILGLLMAAIVASIVVPAPAEEPAVDEQKDEDPGSLVDGRVDPESLPFEDQLAREESRQRRADVAAGNNAVVFDIGDDDDD